MYAYQTWDHNPQRVFSRPIPYDLRSTSPYITRERRGISTIAPQTSPYFFHPQTQATQNRHGYTHSQYSRQSPQKPVSAYPNYNLPNFSNHIGPQHYSPNQNQRAQYSQTWSKIQTLLNKPVNYPRQISYNSFGYKERLQTAENNYGIKVNYQQNAGRRENYHKYFTREQGLVLKDARHYSNTKVLSMAQYQEFKKSGLLQQCKSQEIKKIPRTTSRIEYIPYYRKVYEYEPRQVVDYIYVPVQRTAVDEYQIEHVVDYEKREYQDTVMELVPEERTKMRIQYIPIQQHILYVPEESLQSFKQRMKASNIATSKVQSYQQALVSEATHFQNYRAPHHVNSNMVFIAQAKNTEQQIDAVQRSHESITSNQVIYNNTAGTYNQMRETNSRPSDKDHYIVHPPSFRNGSMNEYQLGIQEQRKQINQAQSYQQVRDNVSSPGKRSEAQIRETQS